MIDVRFRRAIVLLASTGLFVACGSTRTDDPANTIVVDGYVNHEAVHAFEKTHGHHPSREEMLAIHGVWIDNEILYREGSKLPGAAPRAREAIISSALGAIDERTRLTSVTDGELRRWFESRRVRYEQPARFDFEDAVLSGPSTEASIRDLVDRLNGGAVADDRVSVRAFRGRPESNLVQSYGSDVSQALAKSRAGRWLALRARDGWRAMRLVGMTPATKADFEAQRDALRRDWLEEAMIENRRAALLSLREKYRIEFSPTHDCASDK